MRFGETIKSDVEKYGSAHTLVGIPLALAGWLRYLDAVDDEGNAFTLSDDPRLESLRARTAEEIAADADIFGVDLKAAGLYDKVLGYLKEMRAGKGAVRAALKRHLA